MKMLLLRSVLVLCALRAGLGHDDASTGAAGFFAQLQSEAVRFALDPAASVTLNTSVATDGGFVSINITNPSFDSGSDWLGLYPLGWDVMAVKPFKLTNLTLACAGYATTGNCTNLVLQVYAVRTSLVFYLFTGGTRSPVIVAQSPDLPFADTSAPVHPRVLPGSAPGDYQVAWTTTTAATQPVLKWGTSSGSWPNTVQAVPSMLSRSALCGAPANTSGWFDLGITAVAQLPGLAQSLYNKDGSTVARVYYVLADSSGRQSIEFSFVVPPPPGLGLYPFNFLGYGDSGRGAYDAGVTYQEYPPGVVNWVEYGGPARDTAAMIAYREPAALFVHHWGDLSYANGFLTVWDEYLWMTSQFASRMPYAIGIGNHESTWPGATWAGYGPSTDSGGECGVVTQALLPLPSPATASSPWYLYATGPVSVIVLSSEHDFTRSSAQYAWLQTTLAGINRSPAAAPGSTGAASGGTPWLVVSIHRPMYINSDFSVGPTSDIAVMRAMQTELEPLLHASAVDLLLYGHNHRWERISAAVANRTVQASVATQYEGQTVRLFNRPQAAVHYVAGTAGAGYTVNDCWFTGATCPPWSEDVGYAHGYMRFSVVNDTALYWEYVHSEGMAGDVLDRVLLVRDPCRVPGTAGCPGNGGNPIQPLLTPQATYGIIGAGVAVLVIGVGVYSARARTAAARHSGSYSWQTVSGGAKASRGVGEIVTPIAAVGTASGSGNSTRSAAGAHELQTKEWKGMPTEP